MATVNMDPPTCEGGETVKVGVVLPEGNDCVDVGADGRVVRQTSEGETCFTFDHVVTVNAMKSFQSELLQPLTDSISSGYNGALLTCGASAETDASIIKELLANLFSRVSSPAKHELFTSVSFIQFFPDGTAVDLLSSSRQRPTLVTHPLFGSLVGGLCELCVSSHKEAYTVYETCKEAMNTSTGCISTRCSSLLSVAVEWKLHPDEDESGVFRSRLQLFSLAGGASRSDLRGVSPLVKVVEQITCGGTTSDKLLPLLLRDALTGNSRTVLIYVINPQPLLGDETASALALAQKVRSLVTKATTGRWCPREAEQEIRDNIMNLRTVMMSEGENNVHNTYRLAELMQLLQIVKNQSWDKRREASKKIKMSKSLSSQEPFSGDHSREGGETVKYLQDQLRSETEEHIKEGRGSAEKVHGRVSRIQQLKEALRAETLKNRFATEKSDFQQHSQLEHNKAQERRRQLKEDHGRLIQEEVEKMERDLAQEQLLAEGLQRELLVLTRERQILVLQIEALRAEAQQAERDLQDQHHKHQTELQCLREESLQVLSVFRQVNEEQRKMSESRYRNVLLDAVQDAVYLSAQNQQLQADNKQLRKALGELKDTLTVRSEPKAEL